MSELKIPSVKERMEEIEDMAFRGMELPKDLSFPEQLLFLRFRFLYLYAGLSQMPPEQGKREKQEILNSFLQEKLNDELFKNAVKLWKDVEASAIEIRKDKALAQNEKVSALLRAIYGC